MGGAASSTEGNSVTETPNYVPSDSVSQAAYEYTIQHLHPAVFNHSLRVFLYAKTLSERESSPWHEGDRLPLLFAACVFHDMGTTAVHDGPQRFEIEGADAATKFLQAHGISEDDAHQVWTAIALHTSPGIAERITLLSRLVRLAVLIDFKRPAALELVNATKVEDAEHLLPRFSIEKTLGDAVVQQVLQRREKAPPASWPGVLLRSKLENPDWDGVNKAF
jgi:hypothetical protein